ncbi:MAG: tRNA uridine-5-carboxymethylaminomethyl(34) synthesis GTPase MnmE [Rhodospirillales bacterium]|nr:tRNA uridine-5-carboxymethylaminomethyl(34) synthesis GTPase MnmE [Rhodospirillales bacterium]
MEQTTAFSQTIFALASAGGRAGVAVIRVSGPQAGVVLARLMGRRGDAPETPPRRAVYAQLTDPVSGETLDDGLVIWFPGPASFTGEDVAEFHVHGGPAVISGILGALSAVDGLRLAEPGEFTRRAFEHGKMDLTAAEGLADLIEAETAAQRRQALRQLEGELGRVYENWRERLLSALAHSEAAIDFSDEDLPDHIEAAARAELVGLEEEIASHLTDRRRGERLRDGCRIAIIGPPNAGKSSLLNLLAQRDAAIVSETAGTTRDVIEVHLDLGGYPVTIADTAGLRDGGDAIEAEGIRRARRTAAAADLRLAVFDGERWPEADPSTAELVDADTLVVINKCDLGGLKPPHEVNGQSALAISALTGDGIDHLLAAVAERVAGMMDLGDFPALTRARHREALEQCRDALGRYFASSGSSPELAAEDLRLAARALGRITGRVDVDDILDVIFRDFCIGK